MRWAVSSALLAAMVAGTAAYGNIRRPHRQPKQIVRVIEKLENDWRQAELTSDTVAMAPMLSDNYLGILADGTLSTKAETLAAFKSGALHFTTMESSDRKIRVFGGSTAVVTSRAYVSGTENGEDISGHYRYTRVYHKKNGVWTVVSFEASSIQKPTWQ